MVKEINRRVLVVQDYPDEEFPIFVYDKSTTSRFKLNDKVIYINARCPHYNNSIIGFDKYGESYLEFCSWGNTRGAYKDSDLILKSEYDEFKLLELSTIQNLLNRLDKGYQTVDDWLIQHFDFVKSWRKDLIECHSLHDFLFQIADTLYDTKNRRYDDYGTREWRVQNIPISINDTIELYNYDKKSALFLTHKEVKERFSFSKDKFTSLPEHHKPLIAWYNKNVFLDPKFDTNGALFINNTDTVFDFEFILNSKYRKPYKIHPYYKNE